jgi:hypothetical protein
MKKIFILSAIVVSLFIGCQNDINTSVTEDEHHLRLSDENELNEGYFIDTDGDLIIISEGVKTKLPINALVDSEILIDSKERLLVLSDPTDQYAHGILGDTIEAKSVTIVTLRENPEIVNQFSVPDGWVIESIQPLWVDWDEDGQMEILLTLSNSSEGAKLVLFDEKGTVLAESMSIGQGNRWRHALAIAQFGDKGERLLVEVQTPHIGGIVKFHRWDKENHKIELMASLGNYSTHDIGSRVMGMYMILKDRENGQALIILPNQSKTELVALRYVSGKIREEWRLSVGRRINGNIDLITENGLEFIRISDQDGEIVLALPTKSE